MCRRRLRQDETLYLNGMGCAKHGVLAARWGEKKKKKKIKQNKIKKIPHMG